jgi:transcriptional regulator with XRE-family HTH domain
MNCIILWPRARVDTLQQQFGSLIRRRRLAAELGQEALADKASLHRTHVSLLERGKRMPSLLVVQKLAKALDTTMSSLMAELEKGQSTEQVEGQQERASRAEDAHMSRPNNLATRTKGKSTKKRIS